MHYLCGVLIENDNPNENLFNIMKSGHIEEQFKSE
jgi:hypothetical protein